MITDKAHAALNGPDGFNKVWVVDGQEGGGGVMFWAGIVGDTVIGQVWVPDRVKVDYMTHCVLLNLLLGSCSSTTKFFINNMLAIKSSTDLAPRILFINHLIFYQQHVGHQEYEHNLSKIII